MSLRSHPLIARVLEDGNKFQAGDLAIEELQDSVSAAMSALEGDVPRLIHEAMFQLEANIDSARFAVDEAKRPAEVARSLLRFETAITEASGG